MTIAALDQRETPSDPTLGTSRIWREALQLADRIAASGAPALVVGETGTGKELVARRIHRVSGRQGDLVAVNCFCLRPDLAHGLLFGHRRGSFTGAVDGAIGFVRQSDHGTLFLDELTSLPLDSQASLLRVVETGEVQPLGTAIVKHVDLRIVAAAQEGLEHQVAAGAFRQDLYERLAIGIVQLPPLRKRPEDIPQMAHWFAERGGRRLSQDTVELLCAYRWPGNVRELRGAIDRAILLSDEVEIGEHRMRVALQARGTIVGRISVCEAGEDGPESRHALLRVCEEAGGDPFIAMSMLGLPRSTFYRRLKEERISLAVIRKAVRRRGFGSHE